MSSTAETATEIRPFDVQIPEDQLDDLRRRIAATRWPSKELVEDRSQGAQSAALQELTRYWTTDYDWRKAEAKLNALPQFTSEIDGVDIHFIRVRSEHEDALPLIMTHGWPGSVIELLEVVGPFTDPTAHGGRAEDAFDLVLPSLPGYGFSGEPTELGWDPGRVARAWAELMSRLGYTHYVAQGGDVGAIVTDAMGRQAPEGLLGIHMNLLVTTLGAAAPPPGETEEERAALEAIATFRQSGFGYFLEQSTRPQTIGYALLDSPVALAAWLLDHDTDSYYKISRAFVDGRPAGNLTRDHILDNVTLYWLTGTGASAARTYWELGRAARLAAAKTPPEVSLPVGFTAFPDEIFRAPSSWVEKSYANLTYFNKADRGATSPPGRSRSCSRLRSGPRSGRSDEHRPRSRRSRRGRVSLLRNLRGAIEGQLPGFDGATGWLNSERLTPARLRGKVVLVDFWTYTCINWLRTLGYVRAWAEKYEDQGLVVVGVHTPEFAFERDHDNVRWAAKEMRVKYPVALDPDYAVWRAFSNHYWPAVYIADAEGRIQHHQFGEGGYDECERVIQRLLRAAGRDGIGDGLVSPTLEGFEVQADWTNLESPETYLGSDQAQNFAGQDVPLESLRLNQWALAGAWTIDAGASVLNDAGGRIVFRFHARDVNLVLGPHTRGTSVPFRVLVDGGPPDGAHGLDVDQAGNGMVVQQRLYQLVREPGAITDRTFEITFLEPGVEAYVFTFG